ncbi:MAG TPA: response regulator transcription factor [Trueperaceae bacterium]|nr:response regulator transcription factor [Trueperaceae bacterium]
MIAEKTPPTEFSKAKRILLIEDDPDISLIVETYLRQANYIVETANNGLDGLDKALSQEIDLIVLDLMLPKLDGSSLIKELRKTHDTAVIMLTAKREEIDRINGLELGADDYLTKPFSPRELLARIKAILRRTATSEDITIANLNLDLNTRLAIVDNNMLELTTLEFDLLFLLASNINKVFKRNELLDNVWGLDYLGVDRVVDVHIYNLRQKLKAANSKAAIKTIRKIGYKMENNEE